MNKTEILQRALSFRPAHIINRIPLKGFGVVFWFVLFFDSLATLIFQNIINLNPELVSYLSIFPPLQTFLTFSYTYTLLIVAVLCVSGSFAFLLTGLRSMYAYHYFRGVRRVFTETTRDITYEVSEVYLRDSLTLSALISHNESNFLFARLELDKGELLEKFGARPLPEEVSIHGDVLTLGALWRSVYQSDGEFASYLLSKSVMENGFFQALDWMDRRIEERKRKSAWWWRENLSKVRGFGKTLSYGTTGYISHHAYEMSLDPKMRDLNDTILHQDECDKLEEILSKKEGANAVLVGPNGSGRYTVTLALARAISEGRSYAEIEFKRMFLLQADSFELINDKIAFENEILAIFDEAALARNIIFVLDDLGKLSMIAQGLGVDFLSLIYPYLAHTSVSLVLLVDEQTFSRPEYKSTLGHLESITMRDLSPELLLPYLEDKAESYEQRTGVLFTLQSLTALAEALSVYFVEEAPLVKADQVLQSIAFGVEAGTLITKETIEQYLTSITGVSLGKINEDEKEKLLHLEEILEHSVMGQKEATSAVAKTMRRVRSGIADKGKPMGTFLFLGPTGSGKTETAKTLALVFFGSEDHMSRLDMGEYALPMSSKRLLGSEESEGDLAALIHGRPYGVLLLDEFEKGSQDIKDMFLRILDEGVYTNGQGKTISLRTQIIIATSNAGSALIRERGGDVSNFEALKKEVIDLIVSQGLFRPELINRFDETIMFLPLQNESLSAVASKMLEELSTRVEERGYKVVWEPDLALYVAENSQAEFGGRGIKRVIQDSVEDILSKRIIEGNLLPGGTITIGKNDLTA